MEFKVLAVGDVVGNPGLDRVRRYLRQLKRKTGADFVVVNGENAAVVGITPNQAEDILDAGADCITMGNHTWGKREIVDYMDQKDIAFFNLLALCNVDFQNVAGHGAFYDFPGGKRTGRSSRRGGLHRRRS